MSIDNIETKSIKELSELADWELASLSSWQISQLTNGALFSENPYAYLFLGRLNAAQIQAVNPTLFSVFIWGFEQLPASFYSALTSSQLAAIDVRNLGYWGDSQLRSLSSSQFLAFSNAQKDYLINCINNKDTYKRQHFFVANTWASHFLASLDVAQVQSLNPDVFAGGLIWGFEYLPASFYSSLTTTQIASIHVDNLTYWGGNQLAQLNITQAQALSNEQLKALIGESKLNIFDSNTWASKFLSYLLPSQLKSLDPRVFSAFIWGFEYLNPRFNNLLTTAQIAAIDARNLVNWGGEQLGVLDPEQIRALGYDQIKAITRDKQGLFDQNSWSQNFLSQLSSGQVAAIDAECFKAFIWGFEYLSPVFYRGLTNVQMAAINSRNLFYWNEAHIKALTAEQISGLSAAQIAGLVNGKASTWLGRNDWATDFLAKLNKAQLQAINPTFFSVWIYGFENLKNSVIRSFSQEQIAAIDRANLVALSGDQLGALAIEQVRALSLAQIKILTNEKNNPNLFEKNQWAAGFLGKLNAAQINEIRPGLFAKQIYGFENLPQEFYGALTTAQLAAIEPWNIQFWSGKQFSVLSSDQIKALTTTQIGYIGVITGDQGNSTIFQENEWAEGFLANLKSDQIRAIKPDCLSCFIWGMENLPQHFYQALTPGQIAKIAPANIAYWGAAQWSLLTQEQIGRLSEAQIKAIGTKDASLFKENSWWTKDFLLKLSSTQVSQLSPQLFSVPIWDFERLPENFYQSLTGVQIAAIDGWNIQFWSGAQLKLLTAAQVQAFGQDQLERIGAQNLNLLGQNDWAKGFLAKLTANQVAKLNPKLFAVFVRDFERLSSDFYKALTPQQISAIGQDNLAYWGAAQLSVLGQEQVSALSVDQVRRIFSGDQNALIFSQNNWAKDFLAKLNSDQIKALRPSLFSTLIYGFEYLSDSFYAALTNEQVAAIDARNLAHWGARQFNALSAGQLGAISSPQIADLAKVAPYLFSKNDWAVTFLERLTSNQIKAISPGSLSVSIWGFEKLSLEFLKTLTPLQIAAILPENLSLWGDKQLTALSVSQIQALTNQQVFALTKGRADLFKENGWAVDFLAALTSSQVKAIDPVALGSHIIGFNQLSGYWGPIWLWGFHPFRLKLQLPFYSSLTPNQVAAISPESLCIDWGGAEMVLYAHWLSAEQIKALTPAQIKAITNFQPNIFALDDGFDQSNYWATQFLSQLSGEQIQAINTNAFAVFIPNLERLPEEFYKALTPGQIASIDPRNLEYWGAAQLKNLDVNQIRKLSAEQIKAITFACDNSLFKENSWSKGFLSLLDESQIKAIKPSLLATTIFGFEALPARFFQALTGVQIASLNFLQLPNWVSDNIKVLTGDQISGIPTSQLLKLSAIQIGGLSAIQIAGVTSVQYQALVSSNVHRDIVRQIGMADSWSMGQFGALSSEVICRLTTEQIGELSAAQVQAIFENPISSQNLVKVGQPNYWTQEQFSAISAKAFQGFTVEQIANLSSAQFAIILQNEKLRQVILDTGKSTAGTIGWSAAQLRALPAPFIPQLTGLDVNAIAALTAQQVGALSADQLANLVNNKPDILRANAWAKDFLAKLNSAQIKALKPSLLSVPIYGFERSGISFYQALTPEQITAIDTWNMAYWGSYQLQNLYVEHIHALSKEQISVITGAKDNATIFKENEWAWGFLANLDSTQIRAINPELFAVFIRGMEQLPDNFYQALTLDQMAKIAPANIAYWGAAQWSLLTQEQIGRLSEAQIKAIGTKDASLFKENSWAKDFLVKLNNAQIQALNPQLFADFIWGFESLSANFYNSLSDAQIKRLGVENIQYLSSQVLNCLKKDNLKKFILSGCVTKLKPSALNGLNEAHIAWLDQNDIATFLKEPNLAAVLTNVGAVGSWTNAQIAALNSDAIGGLGANIQRFNIRAIANMNLMGVNEGQFCYLLPQQLNNLSDAQIEGLSAKQLKSILSVQELASVVTNIGSIGSWTRAQFNKINQSVLSDNKSLLEVIGINSMTNSAIASMSGDTLKKIVQDFEKAPIVTNVGAIGSWTNEQIAALSSDAINTLGLDIQRFNTRAISHMNLDKVNPSIFANLTAAQANQLTATQIAALTSAQYQALLAQPALAVVVNDLGAIGSWTRQQYDALSVAALQGFTLEQIANLSSTQFAIILQNQKLLQVILNAGKNTAGTMGWSAAQLAALPVRFIPQLTGLDISAIAALTAQQVGALSADQLANLVNNKPDILKANAWAKDFLAKLNSAQIKALKPSLLSVPIYDFENLPQEFYSALTTAQLAAIEPWNIQFWSGKQFSVLTSDQIQALTTTQIGYIGSTSVAQGSATIFKENEWAEGFLANLKSDQIRAIKPDCLSCFIWGMESLPQHFYQALTPGQIAKIAPANIAYWGAAQWSLLTPEQIGQLSEAQIKAIGTKDASLFKENSWAKDFLVKLNNAQIQALNPQLFAVPIYGFERLPENFYQSLTGVQIAAIDGWNIQFWSGAQLKLLTAAQVQAFGQDQLERIGAQNLNLLGQNDWAKDFLAKLATNQVAKLNSKLFAAFVHGFERLSTDFYKALTPQQISAISQDNLAYWGAAQLSVLGQEQVSALSVDQVRRILNSDQNTLIFSQNNWTKDFLAKLNSDQIKALRPSLFSTLIYGFEYLSDSFYAALTNEQVAAIDARNLALLTNGDIKNFSSSQIAALTRANNNIFKQNTWAVNFLNSLSLAQIRAITPEALSEFIWGSEKLTANFYQALSVQQIAAFSPECIRFWGGAQLSALSAEQVNAFTINQIKVLNLEQFNALLGRPAILAVVSNIGSIGSWTKAQFEALNTSLSNLVNPAIVLDFSGTAKYTKEKIASLTKDDLRAILSDLRAPIVTNVGAIGSWTNEQIAALSSDAINTLGLDIQRFNTRAISHMNLDKVNPSIFANLTAAQANQLTATQIAALTSAQYQALLAQPALAVVVNDLGAIGSWTRQQYDALSVAALQGFTLEQIANLSSTQFAIILQNEKLLQVILNAGKNTAGTMGWSAAQLAALPVRFIPQLTGLDISAIAALTAQQVGALSADQLANLVNNKPDILKANAWAKDFLAKLNSAQIKALKPSLLSVPIYDFENLPQEFYSALTTAQLAAIEPWNIQFWSGKQFSVLTSDQIQALTTTQIGYIGSTSVAQGSATIFKENEWAEGFLANLKSDQIRAIKPDCLSCFIWGMESLPQHFYQALTPGQIAKIAPANIAYWGAAQWSLLTPEQIGQLSEAQIKAIGTKDASLFKENSWAKDFLVKLNNAQIQALNPQLFAVPIYGFERLPENFYQSLTGVQIAAIDGWNIQFWSGAQFNALKLEEQFSYLTENQLKRANGYALSCLDIGHIQKLSSNQLLAIEQNNWRVLEVGTYWPNGEQWTRSQLQALGIEVLAGWSKASKYGGDRKFLHWFLKNLSAQQIKALDPALFSSYIPEFYSVTTEFYQSLSVEQIRGISAENVRGFTEWHISLFSESQLQALTQKQVAAINPSTLKRLDATHIGMLTIDQIKAILSVPELMQVVLDVGATGSWSRAQFSALNESVMSSITQNYMRVMDAETISTFSTDKIRLLTAKEIDSIPLTVISSLMSIDGENAWTKEQLFGISDETFLKLSKSVLRAIPAGYLYELTERALQNVHSSNQVSPGLLEFLDETQLAHIFKVVGVGNLSSRQVASISVGVLSTMRDPYLVSAISNLRITQLSDLSNQQIEALRGNINLVVGSNSDLDRIIKLTTTLTQPALGKIADSSAAFDGLPDDIKLALVNTRNIYVFITLLRAVWGSQHIYKQASVEQLLSEYEKNLHSNNMNSTGRHQYQVLRGIYGGAGSWGTAASYLYQASVADNAKDQAKNALQGISYFLTSLKPLSSIVGMLKKLGIADSYNTLRGRALTVIELSSDPILNGDGLEDYTKKKLSLTEFQSLEKSAQSYFIYQTSTTDIYGEVTHIYIQKAASSSYDNLTLADEVRQKKTKAYLGLNVDIGATMDYRGLSLGSGKVVYEDGIVAIHRTENLKHFRENYKVQMLADAFSIGNYVFNLATTKQDGSSDAAKANVQNSIGLVASTLNLLSDFGNPSYWDSAPAELKAKYASPAQRIASTAFAVSNLLNDVASLTIAIMDVVALEKKGGASTGEKIGVYGNLSVVGLLSVLSFIAMVQPEFAPFVFVAGLLAPNFSAIGQAKDIRQKQLDLLAKEQYTYATYIMEPLLHAAIQSSLPIASWFAVLISSQVIRDISDTMARNNHKLVWDAIEEMHNYEQLNSSDAKGRLKAIGDAIFASQNTWDAVLINVAKIADSQFYVTDGRILTYATALTVFHGGSNLAPKLDLYKASLDGVADGEEEIVNVVFGANDGRKAINSIVSGDQNIELFIDASNFVDGTMGKSNSFEIQKSNVTIKGNSESQFLIDLGLVRDLSTIKMVGDALSAKNVVKLEDVTGCLSELKLNLDQFKIEAGGSLSVGGLYSKNFETSYIAGTLENQIYTFGGGMDNVSMTGGRGIATIGGAGSSLIMAKGHNTANVVMDIGDLKKGAGKYDGGLTENKGYNMIDFSVTYGDDLVFIETQNDSNEEVSWTSVYGYLKTPDSAQTFKTDALGGIDINQSAHPLYVGSAVDAGQFTHFDILHTGFNSNYIQLAGNTNISQIYLDGTEKNVLNFNASSINNVTENQMIDIHSAVTGKSEIYLGPNALKSASVTGRGGDLLVNADRYDGDMILDLMNTGANSTTFSKLFGVGASRIDINGGGGGKFIFNLGSYASTYIDVKYAGSSVIDISQHAEMTDNASLHIDSGFELKSMEFAISGNRLFSAYLDDQHELHQLMTLDFGMASNQDNIFLQDGDGRNESMSYLMSLDSLVHAMATISANGGSSSGRYFNGSAYYAADDLWKAISRSA